MTSTAMRGMEIQTVDVGGQALRVATRRGSASLPPLVIFNGIGANLELVAPFIEALDDVEVVLFDIPGVGGSPVPVFPYRFSTLCVMTDRLLTQLGYAGPVDVMGISWGGALAQQFAHLYPVRCRRLILASTSPGVIMVPASVSVLTKMISPRRYRDPAFLEEVGADLYGGAFRSDPALLKTHGRHIQAPGGRGYLYQLMAAWGWSSLLWPNGLAQPALVMHGDDDPIVPLVNAKILASRIPRARLHVVGDGHLFVITLAREAAEVVRRFLAERFDDEA